MEKISIEDAFKAMFCFLEKYYDETKSDELGELLGSMSMLADGKPIDAALWTDWVNSVRKVRNE